MIQLLGPPLLGSELGPQPLRLRPKTWALLARIAIAGKPLSRSAVAAEIFPDALDRLASLRWHLADLKRSLPAPLAGAIEAGPTTIRGTLETDVGAMRAAAEPAAELLALYRGDLCEGLAARTAPSFDGWLYVEQEELRRRFRRLTVAWAERCRVARTPELAIPPLSRLATVEPYLEEGHILLVEAYERAGRPEEARIAYARYARIIRDELGADPSPELAARYGGGGRHGRVLPADDLVPLSSVTIHVVRWPGRGRPVLAIHGSAMSGYAMTTLAERLQPELCLVAPDLRGHGFSDKPAEGNGLEDNAGDVRELAAVLGLERPLLLGFSIGGAVATLAATTMDVSGLILLEGVVGDQAFTAAAGAVLLEGFAAHLGQRFPSIDAYIKAWRANPPQWSDDAMRVVDRMVRFEIAPLPDGSYRRRGLRSALEELWSSAETVNTLEALAKVEAPALLVRAGLPWGEAPYFTPAVTEAQRRAARQAEVYLAAGCSHPMLVRDPEPGLIAAIKGFAAGLD